jgi:hypothetical protein
VKLTTAENIESSILLIRGHKVMLDEDLARLYGVSVKAFNQAVKRNLFRFPADFMFRLSARETSHMRSQSVTASKRNIRYRPYAFTEQGVAMLSSVLRSRRATLVNIEIMRAFVRLRHILTENRQLARRLDALERKYDRQFAVVFDAIRQLMDPQDPPQPKGRIGFHRSQ